MLSLKQQKILLELLWHGRLSKSDFLKLGVFSNEMNFYDYMKTLGSYGLVHGSGCWELTWQGLIIAKMLALLPNNGKDYTTNLKSEIIAFEYHPND